MLLVFSGQRPRHVQTTVIALHPMSTVPKLRNPGSDRNHHIILAQTILVIILTFSAHVPLDLFLLY